VFYPSNFITYHSWLYYWWVFPAVQILLKSSKNSELSRGEKVHDSVLFHFVVENILIRVWILPDFGIGIDQWWYFGFRSTVNIYSLLSHCKLQSTSLPWTWRNKINCYRCINICLCPVNPCWFKYACVTALPRIKHSSILYVRDV